jgi:hypothetical protein
MILGVSEAVGKPAAIVAGLINRNRPSSGCMSHEINVAPMLYDQLACLLRITSGFPSLNVGMVSTVTRNCLALLAFQNPN